MKHLSKATQAFLELCIGPEALKRKLEYVNTPFWIPYPNVSAIYKRMEEIYDHPRVNRMPDLLIIGKTNNGKSSLLERFQKKHKAVIDENGLVRADVLSFVAPHNPTEALFLNTLLNAAGASTKNSETMPTKLERCYFILNELKTKVILIDEIHHLAATTPKQQRLIQNMIKNFSTNLSLSFIVAGTPEALNIFSADDQLSNRFKPSVIPRWNNDKDFRTLLMSFESVLPFEEQSFLYAPPIADYIATRTDGSIGDIYELIQRASTYALEKGATKLTKEDLEKCGHLSPDDIQKERTKNY